MRFVPRQDDQGNWGVYDTVQGYPLVSGFYRTRDAAEAYADVLNATDEGKPVEFVEGLRSDLDQERSAR